MSGVCAAITAARQGTQVVLVQDRPVLGGNASSEVRLWMLGATSHLGNNNRWSREGGVVDEIMVENLYRNKEGNPLILDAILLEKVMAEPTLTLLLNTAVHEVEKDGTQRIKALKAFCSQNSTAYRIEAPLFCDASGDGIVAFLAGAAFRMGAEPAEEFGEKFAPDVEDYGELLGHSMYFYSKRAEAPVKYVPPAFALDDIKKIPRYKVLSPTDFGCRLWWVEYGGRRDTIHDTEAIKWELWKVIYGIWDHIKNSGEFEDVDDLTLEWVATIPGKRESRRFEGHYMLKQQDVVEQREFDDAVAFGGWSLDLHPSDGLYSDKPGCNQWHSKGVYPIPYRCFISRDLDNLFLAGRIISATHVAFGSTRVMATCAHGAQAVGMAASLCHEKGMNPADLLAKPLMADLQQRLSLAGQGIPGLALASASNLLSLARVKASSTYRLDQFPPNGPWLKLDQGIGQLLPLQAGRKLAFSLPVNAKIATDIQVELVRSERLGHYTPDALLEKQMLSVAAGEQILEVAFAETVSEDQYVFVLFRANERVELRGSAQRLTGVVSVFNQENKAVSNTGRQVPDADLGVDAFEFWTPARRPGGHNLALAFLEPLPLYHADWLGNGYLRPWLQSNAWAAALEDAAPTLTFSWDHSQEVSEIYLFFDTDYDHPMESSLQGHPEDVMPFCVQKYEVLDENGTVLFAQTENHQTINRIRLPEPVRTRSLELRLLHPESGVPGGLFGVYLRGKREGGKPLRAESMGRA
jgi:hypothetical protein